MKATPEHRQVFDHFQAKIKVLEESSWRGHGDWPRVLSWLDQFAENDDPASDEQVQMLYLLSNFLFFGTVEIRALLRSLYRDLFRPQLARVVRAANGGTREPSIIEPAIEEELKRTRFVALGNPSESSAFLLYYFRQENSLSKKLFVNSTDLFDLSNVTAPRLTKAHDDVRHYVFIDDLCGSGDQATAYAKSDVKLLKSLNSTAKYYYFAIFGLADGVDYVKNNAGFSEVHAVVEIDRTFKVFSENARVYASTPAYIDKATAKSACDREGRLLWPAHPLGYENSQLLIGFDYNTPDNTLPVFWADESSGRPWIPIFKRYPKVY